MEYRQIGNGPALDATVMQKWLSNQDSTISWTNHEQLEFQLPSKRYRSINGFILPSISFFPMGNNDDNYKPEDPELVEAGQASCPTNAEIGDKVCFDACTRTNCTAVQTQVPELCYEQRIQKQAEDGTYYQSKNACNGKPTHGCTLFYDTVEQADDAYFDLDRNKVGTKYYEKTTVSSYSPMNDNQRPSESTVKWCPSTLSNFENKPFLTVQGASAECSCDGNSLSCTDPNCCVFRQLLTTNWAKHNRPYYNLPLNATKLSQNFNVSVCPALTQGNECCGWCDRGDGVFELRSCPTNKQFLDGSFSEKTQTPEWWVLDAPRSNCHPESSDSSWWDNITPVGVADTMWENVSAEDKASASCIEQYQQKFNQNKDEAFNELQKCCIYTDQSCLSALTQPYCSENPNTVEHGCFGDPVILYVDQSSGNVAACDDDTAISPRNRCVLDYEGKLCTAFPYSCNTGPLYVRK